MEWFSTWFDSEYYHKLYQHRDDSEAHFFIDNLLTTLQPTAGSTMLDLACGKGRHSVYLAAKGFDVTGMDLSEQSIRYASESEHDQLHFYVHDMRRDFRTNYYDYIFSFFTSFGYFDTRREHLSTLKAIQRGLKPGGIFVMDFMNAVKVASNLVLSETKQSEGINFDISRKVEEGRITKSIRFSDDGRDYWFEEKVWGFKVHELAALFSEAGLSILALRGGYDLSLFQSQQSNRLIIIARKDA